MIRKAIIVVLALSAFGGGGGLWLAGLGIGTVWNWEIGERHLINVLAYKGRLLIEYEGRRLSRVSPDGLAGFYTPLSFGQPRYRSLGPVDFWNGPRLPVFDGFDQKTGRLTIGISRTHRLQCSIWLFPALFAPYPTLAFIRGPVRRYRRRKLGLCVKCGYNLTGNLSGVCPECGKMI
ncbi:MAG: hypothetical protein JSU86_09275 [Phycisphaerales bacterium]|nr:MAG: hypothetical protein JSU86_09275 [Phycisphaerales bacterium]